MDKNYDVITFILRKRRVHNIADIIKIATIFIKKTKDWKKVKIKEFEIIY